MEEILPGASVSIVQNLCVWAFVREKGKEIELTGCRGFMEFVP